VLYQVILHMLYTLCFIFHLYSILFVFFTVTVCECHIEIKGYVLTYLTQKQVISETIWLSTEKLKQTTKAKMHP